MGRKLKRQSDEEPVTLPSAPELSSHCSLARCMSSSHTSVYAMHALLTAYRGETASQNLHTSVKGSQSWPAVLKGCRGVCRNLNAQGMS